MNDEWCPFIAQNAGSMVLPCPTPCTQAITEPAVEEDELGTRCSKLRDTESDTNKALDSADTEAALGGGQSGVLHLFSKAFRPKFEASTRLGPHRARTA